MHVWFILFETEQSTITIKYSHKENHNQLKIFKVIHFSLHFFQLSKCIDGKCLTKHYDMLNGPFNKCDKHIILTLWANISLFSLSLSFLLMKWQRRQRRATWKKKKRIGIHITTMICARALENRQQIIIAKEGI